MYLPKSLLVPLLLLPFIAGGEKLERCQTMGNRDLQILCLKTEEFVGIGNSDRYMERIVRLPSLYNNIVRQMDALNFKRRVTGDDSHSSDLRELSIEIEQVFRENRELLQLDPINKRKGLDV